MMICTVCTSLIDSFKILDARDPELSNRLIGFGFVWGWVDCIVQIGCVVRIKDIGAKGRLD